MEVLTNEVRSSDNNFGRAPGQDATEAKRGQNINQTMCTVF
jgi:hypothetical protein